MLATEIAESLSIVTKIRELVRMVNGRIFPVACSEPITAVRHTRANAEEGGGAGGDKGGEKKRSRLDRQMCKNEKARDFNSGALVNIIRTIYRGKKLRIAVSCQLPRPAMSAARARAAVSALGHDAPPGARIILTEIRGITFRDTPGIYLYVTHTHIHTHSLHTSRVTRAERAYA